MKKKSFLKEEVFLCTILALFTFLIAFSDQSFAEIVYFDGSNSQNNRMTIAPIKKRGFLGKRVKFSLKESSLASASLNPTELISG